MKLTSIILAIAIATGGCYAGSTREAKKGAVVMNLVIASFGAVVLANVAGRGDSECSDDASCVGNGFVAAGDAVIGGGLVAVGLLGALLNGATMPAATPPPTFYSPATPMPPGL